ncbi:MAG: hypothetical protein M3O87_00095, partial [Candidatus Dormibacteraeota bacterium]|nr:hypothetical protein [Candidatus Dormibacteraeota bacterium]
MLETIREFGREQLAGSGEESAMRDRHAEWCLELCRRAEPEFQGPNQLEWFDRLSAEHQNVRAALAWTLERSPRAMLEMAKSLYWFWQARGHIREGRDWLDAGLSRPEAGTGDALRQGALLGAGTLFWLTGEYAIAGRLLEESAEIADRLGDRREHALALTILGHNLIDAGDLASARTNLEVSVPSARQVGDPFVLARSLATLADLAGREGRDEEAVAAAGEARSIFEQVGMQEGIGYTLMYQSVGLRRGDPDRARAHLVRAIEIFHRIDHPSGLYTALVGLVDLTSPPPETAARLLGALDSLAELAGPRASGLDAEAFGRIRGATLEAIGLQRLEALAAEGRALERIAVIDLARQLG